MIGLDRAARPFRRGGRKSDSLDAVRSAREAVTRPELGKPRSAGARAALSVLLTGRRSAVDARTDAERQIHALVVGALEALRARFRDKNAHEVVACAAQIAHQRRPSRDRDKNDNRRVTRARPTCPRARGGDPGHERQVIAIVRAWRPDLLEQRGVGPVVCRDRALLVVASRPVPLGECVRESRRSVSDPASSELTVRRRLHRQGDRQLNRALHVVAINRIRVDKETQTHVERRRAEGKGRQGDQAMPETVRGPSAISTVGG